MFVHHTVNVKRIELSHSIGHNLIRQFTWLAARYRLIETLHLRVDHTTCVTQVYIGGEGYGFLNMVADRRALASPLQELVFVRSSSILYIVLQESQTVKSFY